jgi:hypothetical protein
MNTVVRTAIAFCLLTVFGPGLAGAAPVVHQILSDKPLYLSDPDLGIFLQPPAQGYASSNWEEGTRQGFSQVSCVFGPSTYEFRLVHVTISDPSALQGLWDIYRDGILVCDQCVGRAYSLSAPVGHYFKIYVGTPTAYANRWHYSGYVTARFDY